MKGGIIGAGNIGATPARKLTAAGHEVTIANSRGPAILGEFAAETGATAAAVQDVARDADVVFVAIPFGATAALPVDVFDALPPHAVLVDTGNYVPRWRDGKIPKSRTACRKACGPAELWGARW
ncbi:NAD(P)-binding domain-containing protein [Amycolatopsis sp. MEPSY49]|uniref:NAD(P)-binding domain-containing protein n=1 Tax=Amycolatopsis sp. MEPSY49 TaxID=3151600 RepID=UPI003EF29F53